MSGFVVFRSYGPPGYNERCGSLSDALSILPTGAILEPVADMPGHTLAWDSKHIRDMAYREPLMGLRALALIIEDK